MTLEEKLAQLVGVWVNASTDGDSVAPLQNQMAGDARSWEDVIANGLGQITRMYGTSPAGTARRRPPAGSRAGTDHGRLPLRDSRPGP